MEIYKIPKNVTETLESVSLLFELYNAERQTIGRIGINNK